MSVSNITNSLGKIPAGFAGSTASINTPIITVLDATAYGEFHNITGATINAPATQAPLICAFSGNTLNVSNNPSTGVITLDLPGVYNISANVCYENSILNSQGVTAQVQLVQNGTTIVDVNNNTMYELPGKRNTYDFDWQIVTTQPTENFNLLFRCTDANNLTSVFTASGTGLSPSLRIVVSKLDTNTLNGVQTITSANSAITVNTSTGGATPSSPQLIFNGIQGLQQGNAISISSGPTPTISFIGTQGGPIQNVSAGNAYIVVGGNTANKTISNNGVLTVNAGNDITVTGTNVANNPYIGLLTAYGTMINTLNQQTLFSGDGVFQLSFNSSGLLNNMTVGGSGSNQYLVADLPGLYQVNCMYQIITSDTTPVNLTFFLSENGNSVVTNSGQYTALNYSDGLKSFAYSFVLQVNNANTTIAPMVAINGLASGETVGFYSFTASGSGSNAIPVVPSYSMTVNLITESP